MTRHAIDSGCTLIVAVGGDGTSARIATAILDSARPCTLGVVPAGTGNDFAKTLGVSRLPLPEVLEQIRHGSPTRMDVGSANGIYFINSCGFGFDASVLRASNDTRWLKGNAVYIYAALAQLLSYKGIWVRANGRPAQTELMITVSNGGYLGGAFHIAPHASVVDGLLDVNYFEDCGIFDRVRAFARAINGTHGNLKIVAAEKTRTLTLEFAEPPFMEVDGELRRAASNAITIECRPRALSVIAAPGSPV